MRDPDLLEQVLTFLRETRKSFLDVDGRSQADPELERAYVQLTGKAHAALGAALSQALSARFTPLLGGRANIYTGIAEAEGGRWFFKLTPASVSNEYRFFNALFTKKIPASGESYAFQSPLAIVELPGFRAYVLPAIEAPGLSFDLRSSPELVGRIVRALAESNLSLGPLASSACPDFLVKRTLGLPTDYAQRVRAVFPGGADEPGREVHERTGSIEEGWGCVTEFAENTVWGLSHGDLAPTNVALAGERILFLDMGAAGCAPLGSDLFWLLYKNRRDRAAQEQIIGEYGRALREFGVELPIREIAANAYSQYCWKWLIPHRLGTRSDFDHFLHCQATALRLIDDVREHPVSANGGTRIATHQPPAAAVSPETREEGKDTMDGDRERSTGPGQELLGGLRLPSGEVTSGERSKRTLRLRNALLACAFDLTGKRVLDVGCAEGLHAMYMAGSAAEVVGVDHRRSKIELAAASAEALGISNVSFRRGDVRDQDFLRELGRFDLVLAWGFLHRISDVFSLLYTLEGLADALSLEWRTPVLPFMSTLSLAYHAPGGGALDPMNLPAPVAGRSGQDTATDLDKIEGETGFWDPTPGAVTAIARRLGYHHTRLLGYGDTFSSESSTIRRSWERHLRKLKSGKRSLAELPTARVHMIFEKSRGSIRLRNLSAGEAGLPAWDAAIQEVAASTGLEEVGRRFGKLARGAES